MKNLWIIAGSYFKSYQLGVFSQTIAYNTISKCTKSNNNVDITMYHYCNRQQTSDCFILKMSNSWKKVTSQIPLKTKRKHKIKFTFLLHDKKKTMVGYNKNTRLFFFYMAMCIFVKDLSLIPIFVPHSFHTNGPTTL